MLGQVADEVAGDTHVEEELAGTAALVKREGLAWLDQVEGGRVAARWSLSDHVGTGRGPLSRLHGRGRSRRRRRRGRRGLWARFHPIQALSHGFHGLLVLLLHGFELLSHQLHLAAERFRILRGSGRGVDDEAESESERDYDTHGVLPLVMQLIW